MRCFGFSPLRLPPDLDFAALFHGIDERVPVEACSSASGCWTGSCGRADTSGARSSGLTPATPAPGSVALITGGTGGFGRALAARLRDADVRVVLADLDCDAQPGRGRGARRALRRPRRHRPRRQPGRRRRGRGRARPAGRRLPQRRHRRVGHDGRARRRRVPAGGRRSTCTASSTAPTPPGRRCGGPAAGRSWSPRRWPGCPRCPPTRLHRGQGRRGGVRPLDGPAAAAEGITISAICPGFADTAIIDPICASTSRPPTSRCSPPTRSPPRWPPPGPRPSPGAAYVVQPGVGAVPYRFKGVPAAKTAAAGVRPDPASLLPPAD